MQGSRNTECLTRRLSAFVIECSNMFSFWICGIASWFGIQPFFILLFYRPLREDKYYIYIYIIYIFSCSQTMQLFGSLHIWEFTEDLCLSCGCPSPWLGVRGAVGACRDVWAGMCWLIFQYDQSDTSAGNVIIAFFLKRTWQLQQLIHRGRMFLERLSFLNVATCNDKPLCDVESAWWVYKWLLWEQSGSHANIIMDVQFPSQSLTGGEGMLALAAGAVPLLPPRRAAPSRGAITCIWKVAQLCNLCSVSTASTVSWNKQQRAQMIQYIISKIFMISPFFVFIAGGWKYNWKGMLLLLSPMYFYSWKIYIFKNRKIRFRVLIIGVFVIFSRREKQ